MLVSKYVAYTVPIKIQLATLATLSISNEQPKSES